MRQLHFRRVGPANATLPFSFGRQEFAYRLCRLSVSLRVSLGQPPVTPSIRIFDGDNALEAVFFPSGATLPLSTGFYTFASGQVDLGASLQDGTDVFFPGFIPEDLIVPVQSELTVVLTGAVAPGSGATTFGAVTLDIIPVEFSRERD